MAHCRLVTFTAWLSITIKHWLESRCNRIFFSFLLEIFSLSLSLGWKSFHFGQQQQHIKQFASQSVCMPIWQGNPDARVVTIDTRAISYLPNTSMLAKAVPINIVNKVDCLYFYNGKK